MQKRKNAGVKGGCARTGQREREDGPRYVAKGARIDRLVLSAPLPPCLSHRSYVPTVRTHSGDAITAGSPQRRHPPSSAAPVCLSLAFLPVPVHRRFRSGVRTPPRGPAGEHWTAPLPLAPSIFIGRELGLTRRICIGSLASTGMFTSFFSRVSGWPLRFATLFRYSFPRDSPIDTGHVSATFRFSSWRRVVYIGDGNSNASPCGLFLRHDASSLVIRVHWGRKF